MTNYTVANIPQERLQAYENSASAFDLRATMMSVVQISADRETLKSEGRKSALKGADRLLAGAVRRLCATLASSANEASVKIEVLTSVKHLYREGSSGVLMNAMIDAALELESDKWLTSSARQ